MKKQKLSAAVCACALLLTACGGEESQPFFENLASMDVTEVGTEATTTTTECTEATTTTVTTALTEEYPPDIETVLFTDRTTTETESGGTGSGGTGTEAAKPKEPITLTGQCRLFASPEEALKYTFDAFNKGDEQMIYRMPEELLVAILEEEEYTEQSLLKSLRESFDESAEDQSQIKIQIVETVDAEKIPDADDKKEAQEMIDGVNELMEEIGYEGTAPEFVTFKVHADYYEDGKKTDEQDIYTSVCKLDGGWFDPLLFVLLDDML